MAIRKVLVVDDPPDLANIKSIVTGRLCCGHATDGKEAIEKAKTEKPDLIFMDIIMAGHGWLAACRLLANEAPPGYSVVFVTSKKQKADRLWRRCKAQGFRYQALHGDAIIDQLKAFL